MTWFFALDNLQIRAQIISEFPGSAVVSTAPRNEIVSLIRD
jgi:hypothetical protein